MTKRSILLFFTAILIVPFVSVSVLNYYESNFKRLPVFRSGHDLQHAHFINQNGAIKTDSTWAGKIVIANFFFTHCPVICPKMMNNINKVYKMFQNQGDVLFNSFTVDPERDSAPCLNTYAKRLKISNDNWDLLTGDKKDIYALARNELMLVATDGDGGPEDFIHSDKVALLDRKSDVRGYYDGTSDKDISQLIKDIKRLENEN